MNIPGQKVRRTRIIRTERFVVVVEVDAVIPDFDPSEACFGPDVVELLRDIEAHATSGDLEWLRRHGKVYQAVEAA